MRIIDYFQSPDPARWLPEIRRARWSAAALLAGLLEEGTFFPTLGQESTLLLLADGDRLASFCTFAGRDELDDPALTPWAGFCFTFEEYRGRRCLGRLLDRACALAAERGYDKLYLSTDRVGLYEKYGFAFLRAGRTVRGGATRIYARPVRAMSVLHGGDVWRGGAPEDWLDFSANLNPDGPPSWVREALAEGLARAAWYPDVRSRAARAGLAAHLHLPEECVLPTAGGVEAIVRTARLPGPHAAAEPTFQEYARLCGPCRAVARDALAEYAPLPGETLWLCNPNNPTGDALPREDVLGLLDRLEAAGGRLVVDEAFVRYCPERSVADRVEDRPALIVLGSLTKALAVPGVRLGYLAAHPSSLAALSEGLPPWPLNCLADALAAALPGREDSFAEIAAVNARRRERFARELEALGAEVFPGEANFLLCDFGRDMRPAVEQLRARRILVRPCGNFPGLTHAHVRLCVRTEEENARLIDALAAINQRS